MFALLISFLVGYSVDLTINWLFDFPFLNEFFIFLQNQQTPVPPLRGEEHGDYAIHPKTASTSTPTSYKQPTSKTLKDSAIHEHAQL